MTVVMIGPNAIVIGLEIGGNKILNPTTNIGGMTPPQRAVTLRSPPIRPATEQSQVLTHILHDAIAMLAIATMMMMTNGGAITIEAPHLRLLGTRTAGMMIVTIVDTGSERRKIQ